jgi:hypothetical protein
MKYLKLLPKIYYDVADNSNFNYVTNLSSSASIENNFIENTAVYYTYDIRDGDTPDNLAAKFYNSSERYWIILMMNNIVDPQYDWPLQYDQFNEYVDYKYSQSEYANTNEKGEGIRWAKNTVAADIGTYTVTNSGASSYIINSSSNPTLTLKRGGTYTFNVNVSGHPFWIKTAQVTGTGNAYNTGVTNNGIQNGIITFTVPEDAPSTLYYICQVHASMTGTINVVSDIRTYHSFYKVITKTVEGVTTVTKLPVDANTYYNNEEYMQNGVSGEILLNSGSFLTYSYSKEFKTYYDYEYDLNESKREIKILKQEFVSILENEIKELYQQ